MAVPHTLVCVIDDDEMVREFVCGVLQRAGFATVQACDGKAGLAEAANSKPSIVVTDILMERCDGLETISALRQSLPEVRILAMSGGGWTGSNDLLYLAAQLGADDCIAKPFRPAELVGKIETLASVRRRE